MSDKKGSGLDIFDSLSKKSEMPSDSGVVARGVASKAPPPPPSISRPSAPMAPPSLASLSAPMSRPSAMPPPPPSSLRMAPPPAPPPGPPAGLAAPAPPPRPSTPPPPPPLSLSRSLAAAPPPPPRPSKPPSRPSNPPAPPSAPTSSARALPPPSLPRPPGVPSGALSAYSGDAEDDAPTRLYAPSSSPPPPLKTLPRNDKPEPPLAGPAPIPRNPFAGQRDPKRTLYIAAGAGAVLLLALVYFFAGRGGALTVTVTGPGGRAVDGVQIFVDGTKRCDSSPCRIDGLTGGAHLVRASAKNYQETADQAVSVAAGEQGTHNLSLVPAGAGTGVRVSALGSGLKLYVDGQEVGELPQTAKNLAPGEHVIRVAGSDRYEPWEERVLLDDNEMKTLGPLKLRVKKGLATFKAGPGADGARVLLDGRLVPELPATIEVPAGKQLTLVATKSGYSTYRRSVGFDDGVAEKTFEITMVEGSEEAVAVADTEAEAPASPARSKGKKGAPPPPVARPAAKGKAVLNLNSIPVSNVILNGRPLGPTPKLGVQVAPGPQTVVFVHASLGRKVMTGNVGAGETKTFLARLQ